MKTWSRPKTDLAPFLFFQAILVIAFFAPCDRVEAGEVRRVPPVDTCELCPPRDSVACAISQVACDECWSTCGIVAGPPIRRVVPNDPHYYDLPRSVGLNVQIDTPSTNSSHRHEEKPWTTPLWKTLRSVRDEFGVSAVGILLNAHPTENIHEDIRRAFRTDGIDVIMFRPQYWNVIEPTCEDRNAYVWETYPMSVFEDLYRKYAGQEKHILVTNIEADWQAHGIGCRGRNECTAQTWYGDQCRDWCEAGDLVPYPPSVGESCLVQCCDMEKLDRASYLLRIFNERQAAAEAARAAYPNAKLRVWHSIEVNFYGTRDWQFFTVLADVIPRMDSPPDFIGLSIYNMAGDPVQALEYAMEATGLPASRFIISEVGTKEREPGDQYDRITEVVVPLFEMGVQLALVWSLEDWTSYLTGYSIADPDTGEKFSGATAITELNETYRSR